MKNEIVLFTDGDVNIEVQINPEQETVWLTQKQMEVLFDVKHATVSEHISNILASGELDETSVGFSDRSTGGRKPKIYNLDMILSVGYRVNSKRGIAFRTDLEEQKLLLQKAFDQLTTATNAVYTDLKTSADHLAKLTIRSFFRNTKQIQNYMNFLALDMQLATKFVGVYMQVLDYLGDNQSVQLISARYQYVLKDFFTKGIGKKNISADEILQMNYPYTESNRFC